MPKLPICGMTLTELTSNLEVNGIDSAYAIKIAYWIYKKRIGEISEIKNISKGVKEILSEKFYSGLSAPVNIQISKDKSEKYLFRVPDGRSFETVYLPEIKRKTLCVSSQAGCRMGCTFCLTGKNGFSGNLSAGDIINQIISQPHADELTHIVFMGMGEPMDNLEEVIKACNIITAEWGLSLSARNVTVSTVGITSGIIEFLEKSKCNLTLSLHSPFSDERREFIPVERKYPFKDIIDILGVDYLKDRRRISVAYIMIKGINDTELHFKALRDLLYNIRIRVNLIPFNILPGSDYKPSTPERMHYFKHNLIISGISASIRKPRGNDISAACGLLVAGCADKTMM
jgi:23S rRNA (adenine2503-C2)-methyltransferase